VRIAVPASPRVSVREQWVQRPVQQRQASTTILLAALLRIRPANRGTKHSQRRGGDIARRPDEVGHLHLELRTAIERALR
jgi:hypothetical protein